MCQSHPGLAEDRERADELFHPSSSLYHDVNWPLIILSWPITSAFTQTARGPLLVRSIF